MASRLMPARSGYSVTLILLDDEPVGMFNPDAGYRVNFARVDPALLLLPVAVALVDFGTLASIVTSTFTGPAIFVLAVPLLALYIPALAAVRLRNRSVLQRQAIGCLTRCRWIRLSGHSGGAVEGRTGGKTLVQLGFEMARLDALVPDQNLDIVKRGRPQ